MMMMDDATTIAMDDAQWILEQEFLNEEDKGNDVHLSALILIEQTLISQRLKQRDSNTFNNKSKQYVDKSVTENQQIQQQLQEYLRNQQGFEYESFMKYLETLKKAQTSDGNTVTIHRNTGNHLKTPFKDERERRNKSRMKALSPFSNLSAIS